MPRSDVFITTLKSLTEAFMRRSMRNFVLYAKRNDLSMTQVAALFHIHRRGSTSISSMAEEIGITIPATSQLVDRLLQQGFVARSEDPHDRRLKQIVLTARGETTLFDGMQARQKFLEELAVMLSDEEQAQAIAAIQILLDKVRQLESQSALEA